MQKKTLLYAIGIVAAMLLLVAILGRQQAPQSDNDLQGPLLAGLKQQVAVVDRVTVRDATESVTVQKSGEQWVVAERGGYRADFSRLESLLSKLVDAQLLEAKTAKAEHHHRLGLAGVDAEDSETLELKLFQGSESEPVHSLLIGKSTSGQSGQYVRFVDEDQSWLVNQSFDVSADVTDWLDKQLIDLKFDRFEHYSRRGAEGGDFTATKATPTAANFFADALPEGRSLRYESAMNGPVRALSNASLEDVMALEEGDVPAQSIDTEYRGFGGLALQVRAWQDTENKSWVSIRASRDALPPESEAEDGQLEESEPDTGVAEETVTASATEVGSDAEADSDLDNEIARINSRLNGWAFQVSSYNYGELSKGLEDYLEELPEESEDEESDTEDDTVTAPLE